MMQTISAGPPLMELLDLAYQANRPVLLHGRHGVGKSEILEQAATEMSIGYISRDLSLMEPPDLIGIPRVADDGTTRYAPPAFLPREGSGIIVFEELNRCAKFMAAPCLQLLTARRLNDYVLPHGWLPCAAINDADDGYFTDELDPALLSRFLQVSVIPDVATWIAWAERSGIHTRIISFIKSSPGVFTHSDANPRAWVYASHILSAWEAGLRKEDILATTLSGVLGDHWALAFLRIYFDRHRILEPDEIIDDYITMHRAALKGWVKNGQLDVVSATMERFMRYLEPQPVHDAVLKDELRVQNIEAFFSDLPAEFRRQVRDWLEDRGFAGLRVMERRRRAKP
jgi:hypothetical protein